MRRNTVLGMVAVAALGLIVWVAIRPDRPQPVQISTAEKIDPGKTVEKGGGKGGTKGSGRATAVEAATARGATTTTDIRAIGSLRSDESVQITTETAGRVAEITFVEGGTVKAGDILSLIHI